MPKKRKSSKRAVGKSYLARATSCPNTWGRLTCLAPCVTRKGWPYVRDSRSGRCRLDDNSAESLPGYKRIKRRSEIRRQIKDGSYTPRKRKTYKSAEFVHDEDTVG